MQRLARLMLRSTRAMALCVIASLLGCSTKNPSPPSVDEEKKGTTSAALEGNFLWLSDSTGGKPNPGATVSLTLLNGTATVFAYQASEHETYVGTYSADSDSIALDLQDIAKVPRNPYSLVGDTLTLPFALIAEDHLGRSTWKRLQPQVEVKVERDACPQHTDLGASLMACFGTLGTSSTGKNCLYTVSYMGGVRLAQELGCTVDCTNPDLSPDGPVSCESAYATFEGQVIYRSVASLEDTLKTSLRSDFSSAVHWANGEEEDDATAAAAERHALQDIVLPQMLPYLVASTPQAASFTHEYPGQLSACTGQSCEANSSNPAATDLEKRVITLAQLSYVTMGASGRYVEESPDFLATVVLHEYVHVKQVVYSGSEGSKLLVDELEEIMALAFTAANPFVRFVLGGREATRANTAIEAYGINFLADWAAASPADQLAAACWAFKTYPWMRARMLLTPEREHGIWANLIGKLDSSNCPS